MKKQTYKMGTWTKIGKYEVIILSFKEYRVKGLKTGLIYNFTCDSIHKTIKRMENGTYELKFA